MKDGQYRMCGLVFETLDDLISGCTVIPSVLNTDSHNDVCEMIHENFAYTHGLIKETFGLPMWIVDSALSFHLRHVLGPVNYYRSPHSTQKA